MLILFCNKKQTKKRENMLEQCEHKLSPKNPENKNIIFENDSSFKNEVNSLFAEYFDVECKEDEEDDSYGYKDLLLSADRDLCAIGVSAHSEKIQAHPEDLVDGLSEIMYRKYNHNDLLYPKSQTDTVSGIYTEAFSRVFPGLKANVSSKESFQETLNIARGSGIEVDLPDSLNLHNIVGIDEALDIASYYLEFNASNIRTDNFYIEVASHSDEDQISDSSYFSEKDSIKDRIAANYKLGLFVEGFQKRKSFFR